MKDVEQQAVNIILVSSHCASSIIMNFAGSDWDSAECENLHASTNYIQLPSHTHHVAPKSIGRNCYD